MRIAGTTAPGSVGRWGARTAAVRDHFNDFVARHDIAWELAMATLAVVYVALGFLLDEAAAGTRPGLESVELILTAVFILEFAIRLLASHDRVQYLRGHLVDLVALVPPIRAARVLRLLRLLRLVRTFAGVYRAAMHVHGLARHRGFAWMVVAWFALMVLCSFALYAAEHGVSQTIRSPFDALWWGVVTISTVGYGDVYPITPEGRLVAVVLMLLGIGLFSAITATVTSYLLSTAQPHDESRSGRMIDEMERLAALREQGALTEEEFAHAKQRVLGRQVPMPGR